MTGKELHAEVLRPRPVEGGFVAGYIHRRGSSMRVEFLRYGEHSKIVGRLGVADMAGIAPDLLAALRRDGAKLKAWVVATSDPVPPPGVGSSGGPGKDDRTREGAHVCECNAVRRSDYARFRGGLPDSSTGPGCDGEAEKPAGGGFPINFAPYGASGEEGRRQA